MENNVILNKVGILERCLMRVQEEYDNNPNNLHNYTKQDSIILNIQRACEASIDIAMYLVAEKRLGIPQSSREAFDLIQENGLISNDLADRMKAMIGFRNIAVHDYQRINLHILQKIIEKHLVDFKEFASVILSLP